MKVDFKVDFFGGTGRVEIEVTPVARGGAKGGSGTQKLEFGKSGTKSLNLDGRQVFTIGGVSPANGTDVRITWPGDFRKFSYQEGPITEIGDLPLNDDNNGNLNVA